MKTIARLFTALALATAWTISTASSTSYKVPYYGYDNAACRTYDYKTGIKGHDYDYYSNLGFEECMNKCSDTYWCKGLEWTPGQCELWRIDYYGYYEEKYGFKCFWKHEQAVSPIEIKSNLRGDVNRLKHEHYAMESKEDNEIVGDEDGSKDADVDAEEDSDEDAHEDTDIDNDKESGSDAGSADSDSNDFNDSNETRSDAEFYGNKSNKVKCCGHWYYYYYNGKKYWKCSYYYYDYYCGRDDFVKNDVEDAVDGQEQEVQAL